MKLLLYSLLLAGSLFLFGCSGSKVVTDTSSDEDTTLTIPSDRLVNRLEIARRRIRNFEGSGTLTIKTPTFENSASFSVTIIKPDTMYLEVTGPFGITVANVLLVKKDITLYDALHNTVYKAKTDKDIMKEVFKVDLGFNELLEVFSGAINLSERLYKTPDDYAVIGNAYSITFADTIKRQTAKYRVRKGDFAITDFSLTGKEGETLMQSLYSDFEMFEKNAVPKKIEVNRKKGTEQLLIEYSKVKMNVSGLSVDFVIPDDADVMEW